MKRFTALALISLLLLSSIALLPAPTAKADTGTTTYTRTIDITNIPKDGFTLHITLNSTNFNFAHCGGPDNIAFYDQNNVELPHWAEVWDAENQTAEIWVKIADKNTQQITMKYGSGIQGINDGSQVFEFFDDFEGVPVDADYFVTGEGRVFYDTQVPQAIYRDGKTYIVYQGPSLDPYIIVYDHSTGSWSVPVKVGTNPLEGDWHGAPAMTIDKQGYIHVFYGSHSDYNGPVLYAKSQNPFNITEWVQMDSPASYTTYPQPWTLQNGDIFLFYRAGSLYNDWVYKINNGTGWSSATTVLDAESGSGFYFRTYMDSSGKIHFAGEKLESEPYGDYSNSRHYVFYFYRDIDGTFKNVSGDTLTLPMNAEYLLSHCAVFTESANWTNFAYPIVDSNGYPHIVFTVSSSASSYGYEYRVASWDGSSWSFSTVAECNHPFDIAMIDYANGNLYVYAAPGTDPTDHGGPSMAIYESTDNGQTWSKVKDIITYEETGRYFMNPQIVYNWTSGDGAIQVVFSTTNTSGDDVGYAYGVNGLVGNTVYEEEDLQSKYDWSGFDSNPVVQDGNLILDHDSAATWCYFRSKTVTYSGNVGVRMKVAVLSTKNGGVNDNQIGVGFLASTTKYYILIAQSNVGGLSFNYNDDKYAEITANRPGFGKYFMLELQYDGSNAVANMWYGDTSYTTQYAVSQDNITTWKLAIIDFGTKDKIDYIFMYDLQQDVQYTIGEEQEDNSNQYTVTFYTNVTGATITVNGQTYSNGEQAEFTNGQYTVTANPPDGYKFDKWVTTGITVADLHAQTTTMIIDGCGGSLSARFVPATEPQYTVTFQAEGISNLPWSVTIGENTYNSNTNTIVVSLPNGTYSYTVNPPDGYNATPSSGSFTVNGADLTISITFTFTQIEDNTNNDTNDTNNTTGSGGAGDTNTGSSSDILENIKDFADDHPLTVVFAALAIISLLAGNRKAFIIFVLLALASYFMIDPYTLQGGG